MPLKNIRFSVVDVPDLQVLPPEHPTLGDIWMGAGAGPEILHRVLNMLAIARAKLGFPSMTPLAPFFYKVLNLMRFGEHRGGMFVHATGHRDGVPVERAWHLLAEGDDGPYIPSMAIEAIVRKMIANDAPQSGARPATHALSLGRYSGCPCPKRFCPQGIALNRKKTGNSGLTLKSRPPLTGLIAACQGVLNPCSQP
ncbi:MAG: hypothetical protein ACI8R4_000213 [Paracoccaceae bacterium]|jgi:hypothetical protein